MISHVDVYDGYMQISMLNPTVCWWQIGQMSVSCFYAQFSCGKTCPCPPIFDKVGFENPMYANLIATKSTCLCHAYYLNFSKVLFFLDKQVQGISLEAMWAMSLKQAAVNK